MDKSAVSSLNPDCSTSQENERRNQGITYFFRPHSHMQLLQLLKNKYLIITIIFIVWSFFLRNMTSFHYVDKKPNWKKWNQKSNSLKKKFRHLQMEKNALKTDSNTVEKYAREKYFMKTDNEDVHMLDTNIIQTKKK